MKLLANIGQGKGEAGPIIMLCMLAENKSFC